MRGLRGLDLSGQGLRRPSGGNVQFVVVDELLQLGREDVEQSRQSGDEKERTDQEARVEVQAEQQRAQARAGCAARGRSFPGCRRRRGGVQAVGRHGR